MLHVPVLAAHEPGVIEVASSALGSRSAAVRGQAPTVRGLSVLVLAVALAACGDSITVPPRNPPAASPPTEPPPVDRPQVFITLKGEVTEYTSQGPKALRGLKLHLLTYGPPGLAIEIDTLDVTTDADGRFSASLPSFRTTLFVLPEGSGFHAPCPGLGGFYSYGPESTVHFNVVSDALLSTKGIPTSMPVTDPYVSGRVVDGKTGQPISGSFVAFKEYSHGGTFTNDAGRYLMCVIPPGTGTDQQITVQAGKAGYRTGSRTIPDPFYFGQGVDIVLSSE
jgi:hypothetical protein